jgi:hypothetical protein
VTSWIEWPSVLKPKNINYRPPSKNRVLTRSLTEFEQVTPVIRPPWRVTLTFQNLADEKVLAYRALLAALEGRANLVRLPLFDLFQSDDQALFLGGVPHSDGTPLDDGALYVTTDLSGVTASGAQGVKELVVDFGQYGPILQAGQYFGLDNDLHIATGMSWVGNVATMRFTPSLRRTHVDTALRLRPFLICRQSDDDDGEHDLDYGRWTSPTLELVEAFYEPLP